MDHQTAVNHISWIRNPPLKMRRSIAFVSPIVSSMLAAANLCGDHVAAAVEFTRDAASYATFDGLIDTLSNKIVPLSRSGRQGRTYSQLTRLALPSDVDFCNSVINDVIFGQLTGFHEGIVQQLVKVVGELHDNVASHANGAGFSAVQVYERKHEKAIVFAVADSGRGMLSNIHRSRIAPAITTHEEAIAWCFKRGNTTAGSANDDWSQWLPDDFVGTSPYPGSVNVRSSADHHMGEGLWILREMIRSAGGQLWVLTGNAEYNYSSVGEVACKSKIDWSGVALEFEIPIPRSTVGLAVQRENFQQLAEELGL